MIQLELPLPKDVRVNITQPREIEFKTVDGLFIKQIFIRNAGSFVPQHAHVWNHTSLLARGSIFCWKDGKLDQRYIAPTTIYIMAGIKHLFQSLEDDTIIYCIHNLHGEEQVRVLKEHQLTDYE
jgi:hypothetical protein